MTARVAAILLLSVLAGCSGDPGRRAEPDPGYLDEIVEYRENRDARLRSEDGWLSLVGLHWLAEGENPFGGDPGGTIVLHGEGIPLRAGVLRLESDGVRLAPEPGSGLTVNGDPAVSGPVRDDRDGAPDILRLGRLHMTVIRRGERFALRVRDPESPARTGFRGLEFFPVDPGFRVEATLEPYATPRSLSIPTVLGTTAEMTSPGRLRFTLEGRRLDLVPLLEGDDPAELFLIFQDATSGVETYPAGRYLYARLEAGRALLDFNKAYNPPCAFTPFATCPLPPAGNRLPVPVRAGERIYQKVKDKHLK